MKNIIVIIVVALLVIGGAVFYFYSNQDGASYTKDETEKVVVPDVEPVTSDDMVDESATAVEEMDSRGPISTIGKSAGGEDILAYHFGDGDQELIFVGGIHGGYSWNTALMSFEMIDWLKSNPSVVPENVTVTVIPVLNPDGLKKVTGTSGKFTAAQVVASDAVKTEGRFNADNVDLNRNFDCEWQPVGTWQDREVSGGKTVFSEPETQALRDYVKKNQPTAVVAWYSAAGGVYSSSCKNGILPETKTLTNLFAKAAGYPAYEEFNYYEITGDMVNWLAGQNIPAISVLLTTRENTEWSKNRAGIEAVLKHYAE
ncbi:MAG: hypothetical protein H6779_03425 [Candidatus Nomurabacteria bacterium]|nr:hypothetical protein [Candidatus Nomurabacteria bacterium]USN87438.1 MAG: hypothetical protein H6779_03425 [Candidatus Nomurabacteria bacterium]